MRKPKRWPAANLWLLTWLHKGRIMPTVNLYSVKLHNAHDMAVMKAIVNSLWFTNLSVDDGHSRVCCLDNYCTTGVVKTMPEPPQRYRKICWKMTITGYHGQDHNHVELVINSLRILKKITIFFMNVTIAAQQPL